MFIDTYYVPGTTNTAVSNTDIALPSKNFHSTEEGRKWVSKRCSLRMETKKKQNMEVGRSR